MGLLILLLMEIFRGKILIDNALNKLPYVTLLESLRKILWTTQAGIFLSASDRSTWAKWV